MIEATDAMIQLRYIPREAWKRIIPLQALPIILLGLYSGAERGVIQLRHESGFGLIVVAGLVLYVITMSFLNSKLINPVLLDITEAGQLQWRPMFKLITRSLPDKSIITMARDGVYISPSIGPIPASKEVDGRTMLHLPKGINIMPPETFVVTASGSALV